MCCGPQEILAFEATNNPNRQSLKKYTGIYILERKYRFSLCYRLKIDRFCGHKLRHDLLVREQNRRKNKEKHNKLSRLSKVTGDFFFDL